MIAEALWVKGPGVGASRTPVHSPLADGIPVLYAGSRGWTEST